MANKTIINCARGTKKLYDKVRERINKKHNYSKDEFPLNIIFCLAASIGFREKKFNCFTKAHPGGLIRVEYIRKNTELQRFVEAIALSYYKSFNKSLIESLKLLSDKNQNKIYEIAECYANGGIKTLYAMVCKNLSGPDFDKEFESQIIEIAKNNKLIADTK